MKFYIIIKIKLFLIKKTTKKNIFYCSLWGSILICYKRCCVCLLGLPPTAQRNSSQVNWRLAYINGSYQSLKLKENTCFQVNFSPRNETLSRFNLSVTLLRLITFSCIFIKASLIAFSLLYFLDSSLVQKNLAERQSTGKNETRVHSNSGHQSYIPCIVAS